MAGMLLRTVGTPTLLICCISMFNIVIVNHIVKCHYSMDEPNSQILQVHEHTREVVSLEEEAALQSRGKSGLYRCFIIIMIYEWKEIS